MANKQISQLDSAPSIDPTSDFVIIEKSGGGTYKVTIDELVNASSKVSSSTQLGAPEVISGVVKGGSKKIVSQSNMFATNSSGVITISGSTDLYNMGAKQTQQVINITKTAGFDGVIVNGATTIMVGAAATSIVAGETGTAIIGFSNAKVKMRITIKANKDSLVIDAQSISSLYGYEANISGQISISS